MKRLILIFLVCPAFWTQVVCQDLNSLKTEFTYEQNLIIGEDPEADSLEYTFGIPSAVVTDSEGYIYVSDDVFKEIRVYNSEGRFVRKFGGAGRGPGEFVEVTAMSLLQNDDLLVYDYMQFRITIYTKEGDVVRTYSPNKFNMVKPDYIRPIGKEDVISFYRKVAARRDHFDLANDYLVHITSKDLQEVKEEFVHITDLISMDTHIEFRLEGGAYHGVFTNSDTTLTISPFFYRGEIYQYSKTDSGWTKTATLRSFIEVEEPYKTYDDYRDVIGRGIAFSSQEKPNAIIMNNESLGLFRKQNGELLHLALIRINGDQKLYASHFDKDNKLIAHGEVINLNPGLQKNDYYRRMRFYWMDEKDQIYFIDQAREAFTVRRGIIRIKE